MSRKLKPNKFYSLTVDKPPSFPMKRSFMSLKKIADYIGTTLIFSWVALQFISCEPQISPTTEAELPQKIQSLWSDLKAKNLISGSILIQQGDQVLFQDGPQDLQYAVSSISKSFVGWKYYELSQQGLNLNTPVCHWLQNFCKDSLKSITVQMLLDHKAGFGRDLSFVHFLKRTFNPDWSIENIDKLPLTADDLKNPPGSQFLYSNFGYLVLSRLLEVISSKNFAGVIQEVAEQSAMNETDLIAKHDIIPIKVLLPYTRWQTSLELETILYRSAGTGGVRSSTRDLAKLLGTFQKKDFQKIFTEPKSYYRHGWVRSQDTSYKAYWHNGASLGAYSLMALIPESDLRIVILTNNFKPAKFWSQQAEQFELLFY